MPIKNCLKIFSSKTSMIWTIIIYLLIVSIILLCMSLFALVPVFELFDDHGIVDKGSELIISFVINGYTGDLAYMVLELLDMVKSVFLRNPDILTVLVTYVLLVAGVLCRFLVGIVEIPLIKKFQGAMSDNGNYSFGGILISEFPKSMLFSLVKILVKFFVDIGVYAILYLLLLGMFNAGLYVISPFVIIIILVSYYAFKYGLCACWASAIAIDGKGVFPALDLRAHLQTLPFKPVGNMRKLRFPFQSRQRAVFV